MSRALPPSSGEIDIDENRRLLNRYRYIAHEGLPVLAGWLPATARFELKCELGRALWEDTQHVNALYLRLREIQSPAFQKPADAALVRLMQELLHAPDELALAVAFWRVLKPALHTALVAHEGATFPNSDLPSVYALGHIVLDLSRQVARVETLLDAWEAEGRFSPAVAAWESHVRALLRDAGGVSGREPRGTVPAPAASVWRTFVPAVEAARDERFTDLGSVGRVAAPPPEDAYEEHTVFEFERYSSEMLAAETVALVMFHHFENMPWEFIVDAARHLYDEVRHCLMGYEWMRRHGTDPFGTPQCLNIFKWRSQFRPVEQYCLLTMGNEVNAFPYRHRRVEEHRRAGNRLSEQFVRYDIADETQHVRFGNRWLPELLKAAGESRSPEQFTADMMEIWHREYKSGRLQLQVE